MRRSFPLIFILSLIAASLHAEDGTLRIRVTDAKLGTPLHARVSVRVGTGPWQSGKDLAGADLTYGGLPRIWSNGELDIKLPAGEAEIVVSRPFAHLPSKTRATLTAGAVTEVAVKLEPIVDLRERGWHGGDFHVHVVHGEKDFKIDVPRAIAIARAEGQDWCSFGQVWTSVTERQPDPGELELFCRAGSDADFLAGWGMEHPKDHLGHMAALPIGGRKSYLEAVGGNDYHAFTGRVKLNDGLTHFEILRALKSLGSIAAYSHATREYGGVPGSIGNIARELPFDVVAAPWSIEAYDVFCDTPGHAHDEKLAYSLLNRGLRFAILGLTDVCYDRKRNERPGDTRTYVQLPKGTAPTFPEIAKAIRARRTFATTGPLIEFQVSGKPVGEVHPADGAARPATVDAWMAIDYADPLSDAFVKRIEILRNGTVWKTFEATPNQHHLHAAFEINESETAWYVARVYGLGEAKQVAITSPVFFEKAGHVPPAPETATVRGTVVDAAGAKLSGVIRAIEFSVIEKKEVKRAEIVDGAFTLECPADCRFEIAVEGYPIRSISPLLDVPAIYDDLFLDIRRKDLFDDAFYAKIRERLKDIRLEIKLEKAK